MRFAAALLSFAMVAGCRGQSTNEPPQASPTARSKRLQLVYEIDLDRAIDDRHRVLRRDLEALLWDKKIRAAVRLSPEGIVVAVEHPAKKPEVEALVKTEYADQVELRACADICLQISTSLAVAIKKAALENAVTTIRSRLEAMKVKEPSVTTRGEQIVMEVDASDERVRTMVARSGKLEFKVVDHGSELMRDLSAVSANDPRARELGIIEEIDQWRHETSGSLSVDYYFLVPERANLEKYLSELARRDPRYAVPDDRQIGFERAGTSWRTYYLERAAQLTGSDVANAAGSYDPNTNQPIVLLDFNRAGTERLADLTARNVGRKLATVLDDQVRSAPIINGTISGGRVAITMGGSELKEQEKERDELVNVLRTGSLPAPLREVSSTQPP